MNKILIGADPEMFLTHNGSVISATGVIPGTKAEPYRLKNAPGSIQVDNVLLEFNVDPTDSEDEFIKNFRVVLASIRTNLKKDYGFVVKASHKYDLDYLLSCDPSVFEFGCDPDFDAWTGRIKKFPIIDDISLRSAGGHIHIGYDIKTASPCHVIQMMDYMVGLPSVLMDKDKLRRSLYGQAGSCRFKDYGVEYRTPSNFWIHPEVRIRWIFSQSVRCVKEVERLPELIKTVAPVDLIHIINTSNTEAAREAIAKIRSELGINFYTNKEK